MYRQTLKQLLDFVLSLLALIILSPLLLLICILVYINLGTPIIFTQKRPGRNGVPFTIYKFRTMRDTRDAQGNLLPDAARMTSLGQFLRSTSLDELPELINVLKGEMSLVGPRPLLMQYLDLYTPEQARRHKVRPGITGWAQINGRNTARWEHRFEMDVWYVDNVSLWLDIKIILLTIWKVLVREGINQEGHATVTYFQGTLREENKT